MLRKARAKQSPTGLGGERWGGYCKSGVVTSVDYGAEFRGHDRFRRPRRINAVAVEGTCRSELGERTGTKNVGSRRFGPSQPGRVEAQPKRCMVAINREPMSSLGKKALAPQRSEIC